MKPILSFTIGALLFALIQLSHAGDLADSQGHAVRDGSGNCVHCLDGANLPECQIVVANDQNWIIRDDDLPQQIPVITPVSSVIAPATAFQNAPLQFATPINPLVEIKHHKRTHTVIAASCPPPAPIAAPQVVEKSQACPEPARKDNTTRDIISVFLMAIMFGVGAFTGVSRRAWRDK